MQYIDSQSPANQVSKDEYEDNNGSKKIILSKRIADYIFGMIRQNQKRYAVMAEQPHHCHPRS